MRHVGRRAVQKQQEYKLYWILEQKARADRFLRRRRRRGLLQLALETSRI